MSFRIYLEPLMEGYHQRWRDYKLTHDLNVKISRRNNVIEKFCLQLFEHY